jgi:hypothetical protein
LYRLAVEKAAPGSVFHAVAEERVPVKDVAAKIGEKLGMSVVSVSAEEAPEHFGHYAFVAVPSNLRLIDSVASVIEYVKADSVSVSV